MKVIFQGLLFATLSAALPNIQCEDSTRKDWNSMEQMLVSASKNLPRSCVRIQSKTSESLSSGILIDRDGTILTVSHAIKADLNEVTVLFIDGEKGVASIVLHDAERDTAILKLKGSLPEQAVPAEVAAPQPKSKQKMQPVVAVGFGGTEQAAVRFGFGYLDPKSGNWVTTCRLTAGDSGGGLFTLDGELLAIHSATDAVQAMRSHHIDLSQFSAGESTNLVDASHSVR